MVVKLFVSDLKTSYEEKKRISGNNSIDCDTVIAHLDALLLTPLGSKYDQYDSALQQTNIEMFKSVIESGLNAIKSAMILNSGASIAMLAFIGHLAETRPYSIAVLTPTILPFALGAFSAGLTSGGRYLSQFCYGSEKKKLGHVFTGLSIFFGVASYLAFLMGIVLVYFVLSRL